MSLPYSRGRRQGKDAIVGQRDEQARTKRELFLDRNLVPTQPITKSYQAGVGESVMCDPTDGGFTVSLPKASENNGKKIAIVNNSDSANTITIAPWAGETVLGQTSVSFTIPRSTLVLLANHRTSAIADWIGA